MPMNELRKKLQLKETPLKITNLPEELDSLVDTLAPTGDDYHALLTFHTNKSDLINDLEAIMKEYKPGDIWWFCYPKKSSKRYKSSDLSRDFYMHGLDDYGFRPVRQVSINEDWTATRIRLKKRSNRKSTSHEVLFYISSLNRKSIIFI